MTFTTPSDHYTDLSRFCAFLGVMLLALPHLFALPAFLVVPLQTSYALAAFLLLSAMLLTTLNSKHYQVEEGRLSITEGWSRKRVLHWRGQPSVHLDSHESASGGYWIVKLVSGKLHLGVHRSSSHPGQCRRLARALALAVGGSLYESIGQEKSTIPLEELDLSFRQRVARNPELVGPEYKRPANCPVYLKENSSEIAFSWQLSWTQLWPACLVIGMFMAAVAVIPSWAGPGSSLSAYQLSIHYGNHSYFYACGLLLTFLFFCSQGLRRELKVDQRGLVCTTCLWQIPLARKTMPSREFQEIWVRSLPLGARIEFVSNRIRLGGRVSGPDVARWVAYRVARFYAERSPG